MRLRYRPEIDGLRAVAVLGVVLFHAGLGLPGGYVGVDVFFVISGFLITGILLRDLQQNTFSLTQFWQRRIRRILPAVSVMVCLVLVAGYFLLDPYSLVHLARSGQAQSLLWANVFFEQETGYFATASEYKPLLHTWTLALEEQFYLCFPILLMLLYRLNRRLAHSILALAAFLSLAFCILWTPRYPDFSFYLLPTRAWELALGGMLAMAPNLAPRSRWGAELVSWLGLGLLLLSFGWLDAHSSFPGYHALLPVLATVFLIAAHTHVRPSLQKILACPALVGVGLISYSLYLWHWPLFAFARHWVFEPSLELRLTLLAAAFALAYASWRWVENPLRRGQRLRKKPISFLFAGISVISLYGMAAIVVQQQGWRSRFSSAELRMAEDIFWRGSRFQFGEDGAVAIGQEGAPEEGVDFVLWGDSHAMALAQQADEKAKKFHLRGKVFARPQWIPVPGLWRSSATQEQQQAQLAFNQMVLDWVLEHQVPNLILASRWSVHGCGRNDLEQSMGLALEESLVTDGIATAEPWGPLQAQAALRRQLENMLLQLEAAGVQVWLLEQVPESDVVEPARRFYLHHRHPAPNPLPLHGASLQEHQQRQGLMHTLFAKLSFPNLQVLDPAPAFFRHGRTHLELYADRAYYKDDDHLTRFGAEHFVGPLWGRIMRTMARQQRQRR